MVFINTTGTVYAIVQGMTNNTTGSDFMTYLLIIIFLLLIGIILRMNMELIILLMTPLILVLMAYRQDFVGIGAAFLIVLSIILAKNLFFQRF